MSTYETSDGKEPSCDNCKWLEPGDNPCWECDNKQEPPTEWVDIKAVIEE